MEEEDQLDYQNKNNNEQLINQEIMNQKKETLRSDQSI